MSLQWLWLNKHLIPSFISFFAGCILVFLAPSISRVRTNGINPAAPLDYSKLEKKLKVIGALLAFGGLISLAVIETLFGHNYIKD